MSRFIDVVTAAATTRKVTSYESVLTVEVASTRRVSSFETSSKVRNAIIGALKNAGFEDSEIQEGGGEMQISYWSWSKSVTHTIVVRKNEMAALMSGMAAVERVMVAERPKLFSGIKHDFRFHQPTPIFAPSTSPAEALEDAMKRARLTAEAIASANQEVIDSIVSVYELDPHAHKKTDGHDEVNAHGSDMDVIDYAESMPSDYSKLEQPSGRGIRRFRVRFALKQ